MSDPWFAAFGLLAVLSVANVLMLIAVMRQVGVLHQRIRPTGPGRAGGAQPGEQVPRVDLKSVRGSVARRTSDDRMTVLGFVAPGCDLCENLVTAVNLYSGRNAPHDLDILLVTDADDDAAERWLSEHDAAVPLVRNDDVRTTYGIMGTPYVIVLDPVERDSARVLAAGVVNTLEQFEDTVGAARATRERLVAEESDAPPPDELEIITGNGHRPHAGTHGGEPHGTA